MSVISFIDILCSCSEAGTTGRACVSNWSHILIKCTDALWGKCTVGKSVCQKHTYKCKVSMSTEHWWCILGFECYADINEPLLKMYIALVMWRKKSFGQTHLYPCSVACVLQLGTLKERNRSDQICILLCTWMVLLNQHFCLQDLHDTELQCHTIKMRMNHFKKFLNTWFIQIKAC